MPKRLRESITLAEATASSDAGSGRMTIQVITPGWGSSGYYSPQVCEAAAGLVEVGTHMYLDHPSETDRHDRPERSVRDIAAIVTEAGRWDADAGAVLAECQVIGPYREVLTDLAEHIGLSITGSATDISEGEADGRRGPIIEGLAAINSVDFVTHAGRGGRVLEVLESARPSLVNERAMAHGVSEATADQRREQLQDAVRTTHGGDDMWVWVRDFDESTVWFEVHADDEPTHTFEQPYTVADDDLSVSLTGQRSEVRAVTNYVPVSPAGSTTTQESEEDTMPQIEEARLRELEEASGRVPTLESERDAAVQERDDARRERDQLRARESAATRVRTRVTEANANLAQATVDRIVAEVTRTVPLTEAGQLDEAALDTATDDARTAEETYLAGLAESAGAGRVFGLGGTTQSGGEVTEADFDATFTSTKGA